MHFFDFEKKKVYAMTVRTRNPNTPYHPTD
jgi:hypothetical protein